MANICDNRFFLSNVGNDEDFKRIKHRLIESIGIEDAGFYGEITYDDEDFVEGWFESRWSFPDEEFEAMIIEGTEVYFRCLSEEYGMGYVALNVYKDGAWMSEQTFDL